MKARVFAILSLLFCFTATTQLQTHSTAQKKRDGFVVQVASYTTQKEAEALTQQLRAKGLDAYWLRAEVPGQGLRYRVRIGKYTSNFNARAAALRWQQRGIIQSYFVAEWEPPQEHPITVAQARPTPGDRKQPILSANQALQLGLSIEATLTGSERHRYRLHLKEGELARIVAKQDEAELVIALKNSEGKIVADVVSPLGQVGDAIMWWMAKKDEEYIVEIYRKSNGLKTVKCYLVLDELRKFAEADFMRIQAQHFASEGRRLLDAKTFEDLGGSLEFYKKAAQLWMGIGEKQQAAHHILLLITFLNEFIDKIAKIGVSLTSQQLAELEHIDVFFHTALMKVRMLYEEVGNQRGSNAVRQYMEKYYKSKKAFSEANKAFAEGIAYTWLDNSESATKGALAKFDKAISLYRLEKNKPGEANVLEQIASICLERLNDTDQALKSLHSALSIWREVQDSSEEASTLRQIADVHWKRIGQLKDERLMRIERLKALEYYELSLSHESTMGNKGEELMARSFVAIFRLFLGDKQKSLSQYEHILKLARELRDRESETGALFMLALLYFDKREHQKALQYSEQVQTLFEKEQKQTPMFLVIQLFNATLYLVVGDPERALRAFDEAVLFIKQIPSIDESMLAQMLTGLGLLKSEFGDDAQAESYLEQALVIHQKRKNVNGEAETFHHLGNLHFRRENRQLALENYEKALRLFRTGAVKKGKGEQPQPTDTQLQELEARILSAFGGLDEQNKAEQHKKLDPASIALSSMIGNEHPTEAETLLNLARLTFEMGENQRAMRYCEEALSLYRAKSERRGEAAALIEIGRMHNSFRRPELALSSVEQAALLAQAAGDSYLEAAAHGALMNIWKSQQKPYMAVFWGKRAVNLYQDIRTGVGGLGLGSKWQQVVLKRGETTYRELAELLISLGRLPEAERVLEMLKEEEYFQYLRRDRDVATAMRLRSDLTEKEKKALDEYIRSADQVAVIGNDLSKLEAERLLLPENEPFQLQARYDELKTQLAAASKTFGVFIRQLSDEFGKTDGRVKEIESGLQADLKNWEAKNAVIISTIAGEERLHLIVTTPRVQIPHTINLKAAELNRLVAEFRTAVTDPCACLDPRPAGQRLYDLLIKPLEADLKGAEAKTLLWSLDGTLRYLPLGVLWDGRQYLAERFNLVVLTLASRSKVARTPQPVERWRGLGVGVSRKWQDFSQLPAVPAELRGIIRQEGASANDKEETGVIPGRRLLDDEFTQQALERALGRYPVIHIASHFSFDAGAAKGSFLLLGDGNRYTLDEVKNSTPLFSGVELLTLSACNTAMGGERNGEEVEGLGMLAQRQGALAVVASLWAVADESTARLMQQFYRNRISQRNLSKAEALRQAQLALLKGEIKAADGSSAPPKKDRSSRLAGEQGKGLPEFKPVPNAPYAHPYYWAPFILIGNWR